MNKNLIIIIIAVIAISTIGLVITQQELQMIGGSVMSEPEGSPDMSVWLGCEGQYFVDFEVTGDIFDTGGMHGDGSAFITAWYPMEISDLITITPNVHMGLPWLVDKGPGIGEHYWVVEIDTTGNGNWITIINKDGVVEDNQGNPMARIDGGNAGLNIWNVPNDEIVEMKQAPIEHSYLDHCDPNKEWYQSNRAIWEFPYRCDVQGNYPYGNWNYGNCPFEPTQLQFRILGPWSGTLRATLYNERMAWSDHCIFSGDYHCNYDKWVAVDEAELFSGWGSIEYVENTEAPYGRTFEEGQTLNLKISTEYGGTVNEGWIVRFFDPVTDLAVNPGGSVYDDGGELTYNTEYDGFQFPNNLASHDIFWDIPLGTYNPNDANEWHFQLYNVYTQIDSEKIHVIIKDGHLLVPGVTTMTFDKDIADYVVGDFMTITMEADANPSGTNTIWGFEMCAWVNDDPVNGLKYHKYDTSPTYLGNNRWRGEVEVQLTTVEFLRWESNAWDGDPEQGGMPGMFDEIEFAVNDPTNPRYTITVIAEDGLTGLPVPDATVVCAGQAPKKTGQDGSVIFPFLENGQYTVTISAENYMQQFRKITIADANPPNVVFVLQGVFQILPILISVLITTIFIIIGYLLPIWDVRIKILIIIVGIVIAVFVYLFMAGVFSLNLPWLG